MSEYYYIEYILLMQRVYIICKIRKWGNFWRKKNCYYLQWLPIYLQNTIYYYFLLRYLKKLKVRQVKNAAHLFIITWKMSIGKYSKINCFNPGFYSPNPSVFVVNGFFFLRNIHYTYISTRMNNNKGLNNNITRPIKKQVTI